MTWRNSLLAAFGAWFVISAWALNPMHSSAYLRTSVILGGLSLVGSIWVLFERANRKWWYWVEAVFGLYLGLTPFFYGFAAHPWALWVTMAMGALMLAGGLWNALSRGDPDLAKDSHRAA